MLNRKTTDNHCCGGVVYVYIYLPIIWTTDNSNQNLNLQDSTVLARETQEDVWTISDCYRIALTDA